MLQVMLIGGTETTAITMEWALSLMLNRASTLRKAHEEIQNRIGKSNRLIDDSDLNHLPYIQAIISETLRMYPAAALIGHHEASKDCTVGGYHIPRGTILFVNVRAMQNDPKFWEEPTKFKPERFLNVDDKEGFGFNFLPFSYGRRGCPGEPSARRVIGLTLGLLVQCFEWTRISEELLDLSEGPGLNIPRGTPLLAKCKPRPEMVGLFSHS
ncbi:OLC1v1015796C1 [Oldenlandia corymbosa var. corymbosa]|uniref:OLC1v1015796C1 n=1 Tax=Oldenlandia corymbosa var. corymbosa TaxID=529605 RepID=A0AAV1E6A6_OLDCO|nr:OLC1v1015796C1 [Oldenlandia corymbosa var. corymbosa]